MLEGVQLENAVREAIQAAGATSKKDMGAVMKALQARHGAAFDGKTASQLVQSQRPVICPSRGGGAFRRGRFFPIPGKTNR